MLLFWAGIVSRVHLEVLLSLLEVSVVSLAEAGPLQIEQLDIVYPLNTLKELLHLLDNELLPCKRTGYQPEDFLATSGGYSTY